MVQKNGLVPNKDVTSLVIGGQEDTVLALRAGRIAAALFTPPRPLILQREGFHPHRLLGRLHADLSERRHRRYRRQNQNQSQRSFGLRERQRARPAVRPAKPRRGKKILADYFAIKDPTLADQFFELYLSRLPVNGSADDAWMKGAIEFTQKVSATPTKDASQVKFSISVSCRKQRGSEYLGHLQDNRFRPEERSDAGSTCAFFGIRHAQRKQTVDGSRRILWGRPYVVARPRGQPRRCALQETTLNHADPSLTLRMTNKPM